MRLIDADAFCDEMRHRQNECAKWRDETDDESIKIRADGALSAFIECKLTLDKMPTIEERKKGRWINHPEQKNIYGGIYIECSECGEKYVVQYIKDEKFCRNCGAYMGGDT